MAGNDIERKLNEYRLLKSRQRQAERQSLKPLWEQILPERIATVFKSVKSNESIQEVDHNVEDSSPEHNIILNPVNESSSTKRRRVKQADVSTEVWLQYSVYFAFELFINTYLYSRPRRWLTMKVTRNGNPRNVYLVTVFSGLSWAVKWPFGWCCIYCVWNLKSELYLLSFLLSM